MHNPTSSDATPRARLPGDREMVFMMAMVMALNALAIDTMLPALPAIGDALGVASANGRQYVISAYLLGVGFGSLVYGPLSDRFGRKGVLVPALWAYMALAIGRSEEHTSELQSLMRISYADFCLKKKIQKSTKTINY